MRVQRAPDGVVRTGHPVRALVLGLLGLAFVILLGLASFIGLQPEPAPLQPPIADHGTEPSPALPSPPLGRAILKAPPLPPPPDTAESEEPPGSEEITVDQLPPGDGTGIDAFPRPGTKPLQRGLIVPDGYDLPPGFVRHHQTTDSGEQLPPILKFHPDHAPPGAPADRIVPPELAPRDMPQRWLEPPSPQSRH
jgi:hypothetical protein